MYIITNNTYLTAALVFIKLNQSCDTSHDVALKNKETIRKLANSETATLKEETFAVQANRE